MSSSREFAKWLATPLSEQQVVITGISGRFPESRNVKEYQENLFNKIDMITDDDKRWKEQKLEVSLKTGKIRDLETLDAGYFGLHYLQADTMTPIMRKVLETAVEAIMDAGFNPSELAGSKTGVFVGVSSMETETPKNISRPQKFVMTGWLTSLLAHRVSYVLKLKGPSHTVDTACSSSFNALETAFKSIRTGQCENALVTGVNLVLQPGISRQFFRLGMLSPEGKCKVFDEEADGFTRGEAIACIFLQKAAHSRRIYGNIIHLKVNSDGYKSTGITFPSSQMQEELMIEALEESKLNPSDISFVEAHSTGTQVGDPQECKAIDNAIAKKRNELLLIGSVKCSVGHSEGASGLSSLAKVIFAMETGYIAPNINLNNVKKEISGLIEGRMKVVTELTELKANNAIIAVNNFGFGGTNCHLLVQRFHKVKENGGLPQDNLPRLVCLSGRTERAVSTFLQNINESRFDAEYIALLQQVFKKNIPGHFYRGFTIVSKTGSIKTKLRRSFTQKQKLLRVVVDSLENDYLSFSQCLMEFPRFKYAWQKIDEVLNCKNSRTNLGAFFVQLCLIEVLESLELDFTVVSNRTLGKLVSAYHTKDISLEEALEVVGKLVETTKELNHENICSKLANIWPKGFQKHFLNLIDIKSESLSCVNMITPTKNSIILNFCGKSSEDTSIISFEKDYSIMFLEILGSLYQNGYNPQIQNLYKPVKFPVSRSTQMISPSIQWDHRKVWNVPKYKEFSKSYITQMEHVINLNLHDEQKYIEGHIINGRNLIPATEYLQFVWKTFMMNFRTSEDNNMSVVFENCRFIRAVLVPKNKSLKITVSIQKESGNFEILEKGSLVVTGRVYSPSDMQSHESDLPTYNVSDDGEDCLNQDEIYRELNLRGYGYSGLFKGIEKCNVDASSALIQWENNWTTFIDKMLQLKILQMNTRSLYVPVGIRKLSINIIKHAILGKNLDSCLYPAYCYKHCNIIKSGGVEISGLQAAAITKKTSPTTPVLEKYVFVPNTLKTTIEKSARILVQIILENGSGNNFKAVEIVNDFTQPNSKYLMPFISRALGDLPSVVAELTISSANKIETSPEITVKKYVLTQSDNLSLIAATKIFKDSTLLNQALQALTPKGFILSREEVDFDPKVTKDVQVLNEHIIGNEKLILLRKTKRDEDEELVEFAPNNFDWLFQLQASLKKDANILIYSQNQDPAGILGLFNCLKQEPKGHKVRCFLMMDQAPNFDIKKSFYKTQMNKQMAVNIFKDNEWGTYRHLLLDNLQQIEGQHFYVNNTVKGDLSSLKWLEGSLNSETNTTNSHLVFPYYSALNFKDVMIASGRVTVDAVTKDRLEQDHAIGFEFCGYDINGRRVMGMTSNRALATMVDADPNLLWQVPDKWSLEDASTVVCVYVTVLYALLKVITIKPKMSILIHSATGGIGLATLNVCLYHGCNIFVTVGTQEKRDYLRKHFPQIPESHIGNSRDLSFEEMIRTQTSGRGVDVVLNSLSEEKLRASIRCMALGGNFLEIGKFDMAKDASLDLQFLEKNVNYHGVMVDHLFTKSSETKTWIFNKINEGIELGYVKPLPRIVFQRNKIVEAFKYMMTGQHIGKVLVQLQKRDTTNKHIGKVFKGLPRFSCNREKSYIILGGLGGFGLELADWLYLRDAKKLVLVSRQRMLGGYQRQRIKFWESSGVTVQISTEDVTTKQGCLNLITEAGQLGPVDGIFNLAVILKDALLEDQTKEMFKTSLAPKACATIHLDQITRELCPDLKYFVVFSSASCGRGNAGQTNYGMANSIMERICERRKRDGLSGLAIQWGAIGDVGLIAKMQKENKELVIGGTLQQKITSCLEVLDTFLKQDHPVVSSIVVAEKSRKNGKSAVDVVAYILGIKDVNKMRFNVPFAELGMDSMTITETIQILEKDFDIFLTTEEIRKMTFAKLHKLESGRDKRDNVTKKIVEETNILLNYIPHEDAYDLPLVKLSSDVENNENATTVFVLPGLEGVFQGLEPVISKLKAYVFGIQYGYFGTKTIEEYANSIIPHIEATVSKQRTFCIIAYSFGTVLAAELVVLLERNGFTGVLIEIEGSPEYVSRALSQNFAHCSQEELETQLLFKVLSMLLPSTYVSEQKLKFLRCASFNERIELAFSLVPLDVVKKHDVSKQAIITLFSRIKTGISYKFSKEKIKSKVYLFKASLPVVADFADDYLLAEICQEPIQVTLVDGDHATILSQDQLIKEIIDIVNV